MPGQPLRLALFSFGVFLQESTIWVGLPYAFPDNGSSTLMMTPGLQSLTLHYLAPHSKKCDDPWLDLFLE